MTVADVLLRRHIETLLTDNARWQTLLADDVMWELPFAPALGHPARVSRRAEVMKFAAWFVEAVENFHFVQSRRVLRPNNGQLHGKPLAGLAAGTA
jgi:hypothetical protein